MYIAKGVYGKFINASNASTFYRCKDTRGIKYASREGN